MSLHRLWARRDVAGAPYTVCAMFSNSHQQKAERLRASLLSLDLDFAIYEVPSVHRSISEKGSDDPALSKPYFIRLALDLFQRPVLYVDADMCFRRAPDLFNNLPADFAIYNWLDSDATDAWLPVPRQPIAPGRPPRYWAFSHAIDDWSDTQLICSGCVQWWSPAARPLLDRWTDVLAVFPHAADDHCLDVAFNYRPPDKLRVAWLPKEYARYGFWIFSAPVIDHPEFPAPFAGSGDMLLGGRAILSRIAVAPGKRIPVDRAMIIDAQDGLLLAPNADGAYARAGLLQTRLYLPPA
jgi:hypothetical protein